MVKPVAKKQSDKKFEASSAKKEIVQKTLQTLHDVSEEESAHRLAEKFSLDYLDLNIFPLEIETLNIISEEDSHKYNLAIVQKIENNIRLVVTNPSSKKTKEYIEKLKKENSWNIILYIVSQSSMERAWKKYKEAILLETLDFFLISLSGDDLKDFEKKFKELITLKDNMSKMSTTEILDTLFSGAIKMEASDIHFEPGEETTRMRYRLDGVLQDIGKFPNSIYKSVLSRIKMIGKMKLNLRDIAQDGHFSIELKDSDDEKQRIDIRASIIPGKHGESIVMRLLVQSSILVNVDDLGLQGLAHEQVFEQISRPNGMILVTGPTGSGKTTTLYSFLNKLNTPEVKIITIEDPIEYDLPGISQTQINADRGYTFNSGLRAIVRQDPDIVLVGEIRDDETAGISINAALTGHLVFSTLHTNNAPASISRLLELGVRPSLIASSVNAFMAQRLVRKLCPHCREKYKPAQKTVDTIQELISIISPKSKIEIPKNIEYLYKPVGCPKCHGLGYKGRIGIFEVLTINENIEKLILEMAGESEISRAALEEGMVTMTQDGILKVTKGITSMDEIWRVTGQTSFLQEVYESLMEQSMSRAIKIPSKQMDATLAASKSFDDFDKYLKKSSSADILEIILTGAALLEAGDIHIEPEENDVKIRLRIDGILQDTAIIPLNEYPAFLGGIKILSGLRSGVRSGVEDSRFRISFEKSLASIKEKEVDVRVSIISGGFGETVVLRLLNKSSTALDLSKLGIRQQNLDKLIHESSRPNGIILNTGPTGSGKSTTLYSLLKILNKPEIKIITVEDPIEYRLKGILQTQTNEEANYTFATALRALLRQNPDIIMIGEIRDDETATIAVQASLTGHLILSTLHTNDSAGAVSRLLNMDIDADNLASSVNAFMAQRLVRKLCDCKKKVKITPKQKALITETTSTISPLAKVEIPKTDFIYEAVGCEKCKNIGYKGRTTISEILPIDKDIEKMIAGSSLSSDIKDKAIENGMISMRQDGVLKILEGHTTFEEVDRVTET